MAIGNARQIQDNDMFEPFGLMIMFAFSWAEPLAAWENVLQNCLPKDAPGIPVKSTWIRCIQLVCAAMNMGFHINWEHKMIQQMTQHDHISPYQFSACNGHMSLSAVLLKCASMHYEGTKKRKKRV